MKRMILSAVLTVVCLLTVQAQRFALVDMEFILQQIPAYTQASQQLDKLGQQWQREVEAKAAEAKSLYEAYQKSASSLTPAQKTAKEEAIVAKEKKAAELRKRYFGPEGEAAKKQKELLEPVQDRVYEAIKQLALQQGYDAVIDRSSAQSMIFASPKIDISNEVLAKLGYSN